MAHDVFISYSSKDKGVADSICAKLETARIRCWIAPRDVLPGVLYSEALIDALDSSRLHKSQTGNFPSHKSQTGNFRGGRIAALLRAGLTAESGSEPAAAAFQGCESAAGAHISDRGAERERRQVMREVAGALAGLVFSRAASREYVSAVANALDPAAAS